MNGESKLSHTLFQPIKEHNIIPIRPSNRDFLCIFTSLFTNNAGRREFFTVAGKTQKSNRSKHDHYISNPCPFGNHVHHRPPSFGCCGGMCHGCPLDIWCSHSCRGACRFLLHRGYHDGGPVRSWRSHIPNRLGQGHQPTHYEDGGRQRHVYVPAGDVHHGRYRWFREQHGNNSLDDACCCEYGHTKGNAPRAHAHALGLCK